MLRMMLAVLRPTPGSASSASRAVGYFAAVLVDDLLCKANEIPGLRVVQPHRLDIRLDALDTEFRDRGRRVGNGKEFAGRDVNAFVGRMGRQHHGNQELERSLLQQFGSWAGIRGLEPAKDSTAPSGIHDVLPCGRVPDVAGGSFRARDAYVRSARLACRRANNASNAACSSARRVNRAVCA